MNQKVVYSLFAISCVVVLWILGYITVRTTVVDSKFWDSFWPGFWSDLIVGVVAVSIISWAITKSKRMEAGVVANAKELEADVIANESGADGATHFIRFAVRNTCDHCFSNEGIYWHLYVELEAYISVKAADLNEINYESEQKGKDTTYKHITGLLSAPVFPKRYVEIAHVKVKAPRNRETDLRYFLSTASGLFPRRTRLDKSGDPDLETIGTVTTV